MISIDELNAWKKKEKIPDKFIAEFLMVKEATVSKWRERGWVPLKQQIKLQLIYKKSLKNIIEILNNH